MSANIFPLNVLRYCDTLAQVSEGKKRFREQAVESC